MDWSVSAFFCLCLSVLLCARFPFGFTWFRSCFVLTWSDSNCIACRHVRGTDTTCIGGACFWSSSRRHQKASWWGGRKTRFAQQSFFYLETSLISFLLSFLRAFSAAAAAGGAGCRIVRQRSAVQSESRRAQRSAHQEAAVDAGSARSVLRTLRRKTRPRRCGAFLSFPAIIDSCVSFFVLYVCGFWVSYFHAQVFAHGWDPSVQVTGRLSEEMLTSLSVRTLIALKRHWIAATAASASAAAAAVAAKHAPSSSPHSF